jgi:hypothetical protein
MRGQGGIKVAKAQHIARLTDRRVSSVKPFIGHEIKSPYRKFTNVRPSFVVKIAISMAMTRLTFLNKLAR